MRIFIVGAGITGGLLAQLLARSDHDVRCGARHVSRARAFVGRGISVARIDARRTQSIVKAAQGSVILINASPAVNNVAVLRAALCLNAHYLDLASHMAKSPFMPEQLPHHDAFVRCGRTALINAGIAPGLTNLLVRKSADLVDDVETVWIRLFEDTDSDEPISTWSPEVAFDAAVARPILYRRGRFQRGRRFGEEEVFDFGAPVGRRRCVLAAQDEVGTLPRYVPLRDLDVKSGGSDIERLRHWYRRGKIRAERSAPRRRFPPTPAPAQLGRLLQHGVLHDARFALSVVVLGTSKGEPVTITHDAGFPTLQQLAAKDFMTTPIAYATAVLAASFAAHIPKSRYGVFPPEALPAASRSGVLSSLRKRGILIRRTVVHPDQDSE